jgi:hypothetical protein
MVNLFLSLKIPTFTVHLLSTTLHATNAPFEKGTPQ